MARDKYPVNTGLVHNETICDFCAAEYIETVLTIDEFAEYRLPDNWKTIESIRGPLDMCPKCVQRFKQLIMDENAKSYPDW